MEHIETFRNLAELALTIVGFSALISIFRQRTNAWTYTDKVNLIRFYAMLEQALVLLFGCYLPVILVNYLSPAITFRVISAIVGLSAISYTIVAAKRNRKITGKINVIKNITALLWLMAGLIVLYCFSNAFGFLGADYASNYLTIMFFQLSFSIFLFMRLIYFSISRPNKQET